MTLAATRRRHDRRFLAALHDKELLDSGDPKTALPAATAQGRRRRDHLARMKARDRRGVH